MTGDTLLFRQIQEAVTPSDVEVVLRRTGAVHMFWQTWTPEHVYTWDRVPAGFFSMYYGLDSDRHCAIANAIRSGWLCFTFGQARSALGRTAESKDAQTIWDNFGMRDGICVMTGFGARRSLTLLAVWEGNAERLLADHQVLYAASAARLDFLLRSRMDTLYKASRKRRLLSKAEMAVVRAQINFPHLTVREQAQLLGISPRTLQRRHGDIAKKLGVSTFPGAIVIALEGTQGDVDATGQHADAPQPGTVSRS